MQVQGFAGSWLRVPLAFITGSHFNTWSFVVEMLDNLVNKLCQVLDSNCVPVDEGLPPCAGDYRMVSRRGEPHLCFKSGSGHLTSTRYPDTPNTMPFRSNL